MNLRIIILAIATALSLGFGGLIAVRLLRSISWEALKEAFSFSGDGEEVEGGANFRRGTPRTSKCLALFKGAIRRTDASYVRGWVGELLPTMLAEDEIVDDRYDRLAMLHAGEMPEGTIIQYRYSVHPDTGLSIREHRAGAPPPDKVYEPAVVIHEHSVRHFEELTAGEKYKQVQLSAWARVPTKHSNDNFHNGLQAFFHHLNREIRLGGWRNILSAFRDSYETTNDGIVRRFEEDEREAYASAERVFRKIERDHAALRLKSLVGKEQLWPALYLGHNESATSVPNIPEDPLIDLRPFLCNDTIKGGDSWYVLHGNTPVAMITLFTPPEPNAPACITRNIVGHPSLTCRHTIITEFQKLGKTKAKNKLEKREKRIQKSNVSARTGQVKLNEEDARKIAELRQVKSDLTSPSKALTRVRFFILVYGKPAATQEALDASVKELDLNCERILEAVRAMSGADAAREEPEALRALYHSTIVGEMDTQTTEREIEEVASSLVSLIPTERAWGGDGARGHSFMETVNGTLITVNLLQSEKFPPLGYALGSMGSGKTLALTKFASDFLARVPFASVAGCDHNDGLATFVRVARGRHLRISFDADRTINTWDYPGLEDGIMPDAEQYAVVTAEIMLLARRDENDIIAETVIDTIVREVYKREVAYNRPDRPKHEPRLSHFLNLLDTYQFNEPTFQQMASQLALILSRYRDNIFLDAPTHPDFANSSRLDIYDIDALDKFQPDIRNALSFRIGARLIGSVGRKVNGQRMPLMLLFTEMHKIAEKYPYIFLALKKGARMGRTNNVITLFDTHSYEDLKPIHDITANAGIKIIGKQMGDVTQLAKELKLSDAATAAVQSITNTAGSHSQFVLCLGSGTDQVVEKVQLNLSSFELWTYTTHPLEMNARARVASLKPHWSDADIVSFLALAYPRGLAFEGLTEIDESLIPSDQAEQAIVAQESFTRALMSELQRLTLLTYRYEEKYGTLKDEPPIERRSDGARGMDSQAIN